MIELLWHVLDKPCNLEVLTDLLLVQNHSTLSEVLWSPDPETVAAQGGPTQSWTGGFCTMASWCIEPQVCLVKRYFVVPRS